MPDFGKVRFKFSTVFLFACLMMLAACGQSNDYSGLKDYRDRLTNVLELPSEISEPLVQESPEILAYQEAFENYQGFLVLREQQSREWLKPNQDTHQEAASLNLLDFLSLHGCEVQLSIARKNSSLGKFAQDSQVLLETLQFLKHAPACVRSLANEDQADLIDKLSQALDLKTKQLPSLILQTSLLSDEARAFWKPNKSLGDYPEQVSVHPIQALAYLEDSFVEIANAQYELESSAFEQALQTINQGDGGNLFYALSYYRLALEQLNQLLAKRIELGCRGLNVQQLSLRLDNVVQKFFIDRVQVWAAQLNQRYYELMSAYQSLETGLAQHESNLYKHWREMRDGLMQSALEVSREHVKQVQSLQDSCLD